MTSRADFVIGLCLLLGTIVTALLYGVLVVFKGRARDPRIDKVGHSRFIPPFVVEMTYLAIKRFARVCLWLGMTADIITFWSLVFGVAAAVMLGLGHLGIASLLALFSAVADGLDGIVAREQGTCSAAGEVFDAAVDRYTEFAILAGGAVFYRHDVRLFGIVLLALCGSFMVSYATAKAEAMGVEPPKGAMRRHERAAYIGVGAALSPLSYAWFEGPHLGRAIGLPFLFGMAMVGVVGNASALRRMWLLHRALRAREKTVIEEQTTPASAPAALDQVT